MTCSGCAAKVEEKLAALGGVSAATVRCRQRRAYVVCRLDVADSALTVAVASTGLAFRAGVVRK